MQQVLLIIISIFMLIFVIYSVHLRGKIKKFFGTTKDVEEIIRQTERMRMQELHSQFEEKRGELMMTLNNETSQMYKDLELKKEALEKQYQNKRDEINQYIRDAIAQSHDEVAIKRQELNDELAKIVEDKIKIEDVLNDLKEQRQNTINVIKEEQKDKNEIDYHKILFSKEDIEDISQLKKIESSIHNKDVLRKLVYKTYVEPPMVQMFNRIGVDGSPGIYKIQNINDKKVYIGQSVNVKNRLREHLKSAVGISTIANQVVHDAMRDEGIENFTFHLVDACERGKLNDREKYWIDYYKSNDWGYNRTKGGS